MHTFTNPPFSVVMVSVVEAQREILLSPTGTNVWSGQTPQHLNSAAVTWSLAKQLYGFDGMYWIIPMGLLIGAVPTIIQWLIVKVRFALYFCFFSKCSLQLGTCTRHAPGLLTVWHHIWL